MLDKSPMSPPASRYDQNCMLTNFIKLQNFDMQRLKETLISIIISIR